MVNPGRALQEKKQQMQRQVLFAVSGEQQGRGSQRPEQSEPDYNSVT